MIFRSAFVLPEPSGFVPTAPGQGAPAILDAGFWDPDPAPGSLWIDAGASLLLLASVGVRSSGPSAVAALPAPQGAAVARDRGPSTVAALPAPSGAVTLRVSGPSAVASVTVAGAAALRSAGPSGVASVAVAAGAVTRSPGASAAGVCPALLGNGLARAALLVTSVDVRADLEAASGDGLASLGGTLVAAPVNVRGGAIVWAWTLGPVAASTVALTAPPARGARATSPGPTSVVMSAAGPSEIVVGS
jgi:hypothetical protein